MRAIAFPSFCLAIGLTTATPTPASAADVVDAPRVAIEAVATEGQAPFTLHVHGLGTELAAGTPLTARYEWDFGDGAPVGTTIEGWNAGHVYDAPGVYTVTLRVTDEYGGHGAATLDVHVEPDTRRTVFLSADGDDRASGATPATAFRTLDRAIKWLGDGSKLLLRRGDVFETGRPLLLSGREILVGTYGDGPPPTIRWTGPLGHAAIIETRRPETHAITIQGIRFDSVHTEVHQRNLVDAIRPDGTCFTVRDCVFEHVTTAINAEREPRGLLSADNRARQLRAYFVWGEGSDHVHLRNAVDGSGHEHNLRFAEAERVLVSGNHLVNSPKRCLWAMTGTHIYVTHNHLEGGRLTVGPNHAVGAPSDRWRWAVVEGNVIDKAATMTSAVEIEPGAEQVVLRNNVILADGVSAVRLGGRDEAMSRTTADVHVVCNTAVNTSDRGRFLEGGPDLARVTLAGNLYEAPELVTGRHRSAVVFILDDDLAGFESIRDNVWPDLRAYAWVQGGVHYVWPRWSDAKGYRSRDAWTRLGSVENDGYADVPFEGAFRPRAGSLAHGHVRVIAGVWQDIHGAPRPRTDGWSAGAVEVSEIELAGRPEMPTVSY